MLNGSQLLTTAPVEPMPVRPAVQPTQASPTPMPDDDLGQMATPAGAPDVELEINQTMVRVYAVFQVDPETKELQVSVVDDEGRLVRMIPPHSVAEMISAMASYSRR